MKLENQPDFYYVVCPPVQSDKHLSCTIQLGPPAVCTTHLHIRTRATLQPCFTSEDTNELTPYVINATFTEWPFGLFNDTRTSLEHYNIPPLSDGCLMVVYDFIALTQATLGITMSLFRKVCLKDI